jgi:putative ABC transport system substrate-binding protein
MRKKITGQALCSVLLALSLSAEAQQPAKLRRIGVLSPGSANPDLEIFRQGLHNLGYMEGQNIALEYRWAAGNEERLPALAAELVHAKVAIILATSPNGARAAQQLTSTIPIVVTAIGNVEGLVNRLDRPGRNITGLSFMSPELGGKRLELLTETIPGLSRVAFLSNMINPEGAGQSKEIKVVARALGVQLQILQVKKPEDIDNAFSSIVRARTEAVTVGSPATFTLNRTRIVELAAKSRLPAIYHRNEFVEAGGLMSYGPDHTDLYRRAAIYVDKILKGAKPADLPVEQPMKFELVINLRTAKTLGLTIPSKVLMWADRVIK